MPFICKIRTDVPDGLLQVLDLRPNSSQRNLIYTPGDGQTKYVNRAENDTVATTTSGANDVTTAAYSGVAAYLLDHVEGGGLAAGTAALTDANANTIALALIAAMDTGAVMTIAAVNVILSATVANTELVPTTSASTGVLTELLQVLAGGKYVLPAGSITEAPTGTFDPTVAGAFTNGTYRPTYTTGALRISTGIGRLAQFIAATFDYNSTTGAALVVYADDGTVFVP